MEQVTEAVTYTDLTLRHTRNNSLTPHAWASQPRWVWGISPSTISGTWPTQWLLISCRLLDSQARAAGTAERPYR
jgi:hypothetical protein